MELASEILYTWQVREILYHFYPKYLDTLIPYYTYDLSLNLNTAIFLLVSISNYCSMGGK